MNPIILEKGKLGQEQRGSQYEVMSHNTNTIFFARPKRGKGRQKNVDQCQVTNHKILIDFRFIGRPADHER